MKLTHSLLTLSLVLAAGTLCAAPTHNRANSAKPKSASPAASASSQPTASGAAEAKPTAVGDDPMSQAFGADFIKSIHAKSINYVSGGNGADAMELDGNVRFEGETLLVECEHMTADPDKKMMIATGSPVKINSTAPGNQLKAECRKYTYNLETKESRLTGNPIIYQQKAGKTTKIAGDVVIIKQDSNGRQHVTITQNSESSSQPSIVVTNDSAGSDKASTPTPKKTPPEKVDTTNNKGLDAIKLPEFSL